MVARRASVVAVAIGVALSLLLLSTDDSSAQHGFGSNYLQYNVRNWGTSNPGTLGTHFDDRFRWMFDTLTVANTRWENARQVTNDTLEDGLLGGAFRSYLGPSGSTDEYGNVNVEASGRNPGEYFVYRGYTWQAAYGSCGTWHGQAIYPGVAQFGHTNPRNGGLLYFNSTCHGVLSNDHLQRDARHEVAHLVQVLADHGCGYSGLMNSCEDMFWWYLSCTEVKSARGYYPNWPQITAC